ncbi:MAG: SWIM zinc finger family protein [Synergistaceae bacterium]|jgi:uncharacterized Zn finger protein|nr:SWIM zinc finger family protein [Synergistaceae bacterium]
MRGGYFKYIPIGTKCANAQKQLAHLKKKDPDISPIVVEGNKVVTTWWGEAWIDNLEGYADYENRIGRGRSYVKNGLVLDLRISPGLLTSLVSGSRKTPYEVRIEIDPLSPSKWKAIVEQIGRRISNMEDLVRGRFPEELKEIFLRRGEGLFPSPKEIHMSCSCPDWAYMCKHVAAALYGAGTRLDRDPPLFFTLRRVDFSSLLKKSIDEKMNSMLKNAGKKTSRVIDDADVTDLFGLQRY